MTVTPGTATGWYAVLAVAAHAASVRFVPTLLFGWVTGRAAAVETGRGRTSTDSDDGLSSVTATAVDVVDGGVKRRDAGQQQQQQQQVPVTSSSTDHDAHDVHRSKTAISSDKVYHGMHCKG